MTAVESLITLPSSATLTSPSWGFLLLEYMEEFATLAWYLVADDKLVEETFARTMMRLDTIPFNASAPVQAYSQARDILITQALEVLAVVRKEDEDNRLSQPSSGELPDLPRLAFMLIFVIRSSASEVAKLLDVTPSQVQGLVQRAIDHLVANGPLSVPITWHNV